MCLLKCLESYCHHLYPFRSFPPASSYRDYSAPSGGYGSGPAAPPAAPASGGQWSSGGGSGGYGDTESFGGGASGGGGYGRQSYSKIFVMMLAYVT